MAYLTYEELAADAQKYKDDLSNQFTELKKNQESINRVDNGPKSYGIVKPQVLIEEKKVYWPIIVLVVLGGYLYMKGKLKL